MTVLNTRDPEVVTKTVTDSQVEVTQLMRPQQGNFAGNVHGGVSLGLMDEDRKWQCEGELRRSLRKEFSERLATGICQISEA